MAIAQALGQQTQSLLQAGTKKLLGKVQQRGSLIESLSSVIPMAPASTRKVTSPSSSQSLPDLKHAASLGGSPVRTKQESGTESLVSPADSDSVPVIWNNVVLDSTMEDSDTAQQEGLLSKLTNKVKQMASPERQVYKKGVTEYQFDDLKGQTRVGGGAVAAVPAERGTLQQQSVVSEISDIGSDDLPPGVMTNSNTDSGIDQVMMETPSGGYDVMTRENMPRNTDPRKRWSDTAAKWMGMESSRKMEEGLTEVKKRWSSFGTSMLKMFDKLVLNEPGTDMESPPWDELPPKEEANPLREELSPDVPPIPPPKDFSDCETLVDIEQILNEAPAGLQVWGVSDQEVMEEPIPVVKLRRPQKPERKFTHNTTQDK